MTEEKKTEVVESLGEYLKRLRRAKNLSFADVQKESRIPPGALRAIEENDFEALPANTFARGFYTLYAKYLEIDPADILKRLDQERTLPQTKQKFIPPSKLEKNINTMASGSWLTPGSLAAICVVVLVAVIAFLCYYFSFNPAAFISTKLSSLQPPAQEETRTPENAQGSSDTSGLQQAQQEARYFLTLDFHEDTTLTITVDGGLPVKESYSQGATQSWYANKELSLILPEAADVDLFFDGQHIDLPQPEDGAINLKFP